MVSTKRLGRVSDLGLEEDADTRLEPPARKKSALFGALIALVIAAIGGLTVIVVFLISEVNSLTDDNVRLRAETAQTVDTEDDVSRKDGNTHDPQADTENSSRKEIEKVTDSVAPSSDSEANSPADALEPPTFEPSEAELFDKIMESDDPPWDTLESGRLYMRWAEDEEFSCGYYRCAALVFYASEPCLSGVYVKASIIVDDVVVGWTNDRTGGLGTDEVAIAILEDYNDYSGDLQFRITEAYCTRY